MSILFFFCCLLSFSSSLTIFLWSSSFANNQKWITTRKTFFCGYFAFHGKLLTRTILGIYSCVQKLCCIMGIILFSTRLMQRCSSFVMKNDYESFGLKWNNWKNFNNRQGHAHWAHHGIIKHFLSIRVLCENLCNLIRAIKLVNQAMKQLDVIWLRQKNASWDKALLRYDVQTPHLGCFWRDFICNSGSTQLGSWFD